MCSLRTLFLFNKNIFFSLEEQIVSKKAFFCVLIKAACSHWRKFGKDRKAQRRYHPDITTDYIFGIYPTLNEFKSFLLPWRILFWKLLVNEQREAKHKQVIAGLADHGELKQPWKLKPPASLPWPPPSPSCLSTHFLAAPAQASQEKSPQGRVRSTEF